MLASGAHAAGGGSALCERLPLRRPARRAPWRVEAFAVTLASPEPRARVFQTRQHEKVTGVASTRQANGVLTCKYTCPARRVETAPVTLPLAAAEQIGLPAAPVAASVTACFYSAGAQCSQMTS